MNPDLFFGSHEQVVFLAEQGVAHVPTKLGLAKDVPSNLVPELVLSRSDKFDMTLEVEILTENLERLGRKIDIEHPAIGFCRRIEGSWANAGTRIQIRHPIRVPKSKSNRKRTRLNYSH